MKNFRLLLSVMTKNNEMDMPESGSKAKAYRAMGIIAMCCIMIPCCFIVGYIVYIMTEALMEAGGMTEGLDLVIQLMSVFGVIFSIMVIFNILYFSSDLDHLLPLPVKPAELVAAKFTHAYLAESVMEFMILFCGFIGYFIAAGPGVVTILTAVLGVFLLPVLPLVYCGIVSLVTMAFFSRIKLLRNVDFMVGLVTILFAALFLWSFAQMDSVDITNYIDSLKNGENIFVNVMNGVFFTVPLFLAALEKGSVLYMLLFVLANAACVAVLLLLGNKLYIRGVSLVSSAGGQTGRRGGHASGAKAYHLRSPFAAYLSKEIKMLVRTPAYRKYCVLVNIIWPILIVALFRMPSTAGMIDSFRTTYKSGFVLSDEIVLMAVIAMAFFATAMNSIASTSFTREGEHISFVKHIPVSYRLQLRAKIFVSMIFGGITVAVSTLLLCVLMGCPVAATVYFVLLSLISAAICTYTGILLDSLHPKLDWEDEYGALRGNLNAFFNMAIAIALAIVLCAFGWILFRYTQLYTDAIYIIYILILAAVCALLRRYTYVLGERHIATDVYSE